MRRLSLFLALAALTSCRPKAKTIIEDEGAALAQTVDMGRPEHAKQLAAGFFGIEDGSWRWTAKRFAVVVRPPLRAPSLGSRLVFKFAYPQPVAAKLGTVTLRATIGGHALPPRSYSKPENHVYEAAVPASWTPGDTARIEFELDKALPPAGAEHRELGLIATSIGLRP